MVSWQAKAEREKIVAGVRDDRRRYPDSKPVEQRRRDWDAQARLVVLPAGARFDRADADGVAAEWMEMPGARRDRTLLLLHGGGHNSGSPKTHRGLAALLSRAAGMRVLTPDFRLAPEHPFPAAAIDALKAYGYLLAQGVEARNIVFAGDSSGGGLVLTVLLALREARTRMPRAALLLSPWTDLTLSTSSQEHNANRDPLVTREALAEAARWYAGRHDLAGPMLSPFFVNPRGLPPLLVHVGGDEVLLDDSRVFAEHATESGVSVTYQSFEGMWHVFHNWAPAVPEAVEALDAIAAFIRAQFGD